MKVKSAVAVAVLTLSACSVGKSTKQDPNYLRNNHAAASSVSRSEPLETLFDRISLGASSCYATTSGWMPVSQMGAMSILSKAPGRTVESKFDENGRSGIIRVFVDGNFYLPMFQVDLQESNGQVRVDAYYRSENSLQNKFLHNVSEWVAGNSDFCEMNWLEDRKKSRKH
jgi:hypothetical protein